MKVLVTTPTGNIGRRIVPELLAPEFSVRVIVRDPARLPEEVREHMGMRPFWRCLAMTRNALIDLEPRKTADKDPVRTEPWHDLHERVVRCKERAAETCP